MKQRQEIGVRCSLLERVVYAALLCALTLFALFVVLWMRLWRLPKEDN